MKWTVLWTEETENELTAIWLRDAERSAITTAAYQIERHLRANPDQMGEDFYGDRIFQYGPLAVVYELKPDDRLVRITQAMRIKGS